MYVVGVCSVVDWVQVMRGHVGDCTALDSVVSHQESMNTLSRKDWR
jgi:hypothetical protein